MVATTAEGKFISSASEQVPVDVLPGQTARDGEDYAAIVAGPLTSDPSHPSTAQERWVHRQENLGSGGERALIWSRLLATHEDKTAIKVKRHATKTDVHEGAERRNGRDWTTAQQTDLLVWMQTTQATNARLERSSWFQVF